MTRPSGSPLQSNVDGDVNPVRSMPPGDFEAIKADIKKKFQKMEDSVSTPGNHRGMGPNQSQFESFEYNHSSVGRPISGGPIRFPGEKKPFRQGPQGDKSFGPTPLMEITIPNPDAVRQKLNQGAKGEGRTQSRDSGRPAEKDPDRRDHGMPSGKGRGGMDRAGPSNKESVETEYGRPSQQQQSRDHGRSVGSERRDGTLENRNVRPNNPNNPHRRDEEREMEMHGPPRMGPSIPPDVPPFGVRPGFFGRPERMQMDMNMGAGPSQFPVGMPPRPFYDGPPMVHPRFPVPMEPPGPMDPKQERQMHPGKRKAASKQENFAKQRKRSSSESGTQNKTESKTEDKKVKM